MPNWPEPDRPGFTVFHEDYRPGGYGSGKPEDEAYFPKPRIEAYMKGLLVHPGNFLGLVDRAGETLQFYVNDDRSVLIDFIVKARRGSMQATGTLDDCVGLLHAAGPSLAALVIPGAEFTPW